MPQVEDVARPPCGGGEDRVRRRCDPLPRAEEQRRVEVPLDALRLAHGGPALVERDAPVEPDHVPSGRGHERQQRRGAGPEVDRRHVDRGEDPRRPGRDELRIVRGRERADPRVEELDHVGAGAHRLLNVSREPVGEALHQGMPRLRLGVHERLHARKVAARLALDEIAGDRERPAAEADDGLPGGELAAHDADALEQVRERLLRLGRPQARHVGGRADRLLDDRADALDELDLHSRPENRRHDVREHHGRIDVVPVHRLEGHLRAESPLRADLEERVLLADRAILRERASRLAHEPHRRPLDGFAVGRAHEKRDVHEP